VAHPVFQEPVGLVHIQAKVARPEFRVIQVIQDHGDFQEQVERLAHKEHLEPQENLVVPALAEHKAFPDLVDQLGPVVYPDSQAQLDHKEAADLPVHREQKDLRDIQVLVERQDHKVGAGIQV
jgi:hypothetical protein